METKALESELLELEKRYWQALKVCVLHTEAIAGDPFGRDRRAIE